jgi:hypothetical protein
VEEILAAMPGVIAARANVLTGGVLVCYQAETLSPARILEELEDQNYLEGNKIRFSDGDFRRQTAATTGEKIGRALVGRAVARVLEANGLALLAALISL